MRILIFSFCGIGDMVNFTPALRNLKSNYPDVKIDVIARNNNLKELIKNEPYVNEIIVYPNNFIIDTWTGLFKEPKKIANLRHLPDEVKLLLLLRKRKYDISIWAWPGETKRAAIVSRITDAKIKLGFSYSKAIGHDSLYSFSVDPMQKAHSLEQNLKLIESLGCRINDKKPVLTLTEDENKFAVKFLDENRIVNKKIIGIHPGSDKNGKIRRWPIEKFSETISKIKNESKAEVIVFLGPDEIELRDELEKSISAKITFATFNELRKTIAVISKCSLMLTTDSGLGHIANAFSVPVIAIFGPANDIHTRPYGDRNIIISKHVECSPCKYMAKGFICPYDRKCLTQITSEEVAKKVLEKLL
jgi:heptosyltransferase-2